jgi:spore coat protein U-like protein
MKKKNNNFNSISLKKNKISLAKTTTALTCLIGLVMFSGDSGKAQTTTTGSMVVSTSVSASCTIAADTMTFAAYAQSEITATSVITANCTNGTAYTISFNNSPNSGSAYYLLRSGQDGSNAADRIEVIFTKSAGQTMTNAAATITGTGTGSSAAAGTITGTIAASQTGKTAGSYSKTMTLNIVY